MNHTIGKQVAIALTAAVLTATGCVPMTDAQREAREYGRVEFRNQFIEDRARCLASGRRIYIQGPGGMLDRDQIPRMRVRYVCS